jgi:hypothetical protein
VKWWTSRSPVSFTAGLKRPDSKDHSFQHHQGGFGPLFDAW